MLVPHPHRSLVALLTTLVLPGAAALADGTFTPVGEIPGVVEPPSTIMPLNAPQVILGLADRYIVNVPSLFTSFPDHPEVTADFVTFESLPKPVGAVYCAASFAAQDGWPVLGRALFYGSGQSFPQTPTVYRSCMWWGDGTVTLLSVSPAVHIPFGMSDDGEHWLLQAGSSLSHRSYRGHGVSLQNIVPDPNEEPQLDTQVFALSPDGLTAAGMYNDSHWDFFTWSESEGAVVHVSPIGRISPPAMVANSAARIVLRPTADPYAENISNATFSRGVWRRTPGFAALTMTRDGRTLLGSVRTGADTYSARLWTETLGVRPLAAELTARGINLRGWTLTHADFITDDSRTIVGRGFAPGVAGTRWWVVVLPAPIAAADIASAGAAEGGDGELDNNDLIVFIGRFFAHDEQADVAGPGAERTPDGAFDNNDFIRFITLFFSAEP